MDRKEICRLIATIKGGQLRTVISALKETNNVPSSRDALNLIISCCTICAGEPDDLDCGELVTLLWECFKHIRKLEDHSWMSYLQSMYYIVKYLCNIVSIICYFYLQ